MGAYFIWVGLLVVEVLWFLTLTNHPHGTDDILFRLVVIAVTIAIGAVGLNLMEKWRK